MSNSEIQKPSELLSEFNANLEWLEPKIPSLKKSRFARYGKTLNTHLSIESDHSFPGELAYGDQLWLSLFEISEFNYLCRGLKGMDVLPLEKLVQIVKGRDVLHEDGSHTPGRDYAWELIACSFFVQHGITPFFESDAEFLFRINTREFHVECKRIKSIKQIEKRIISANEKLNSIILERKETRLGIVLIDYTPLMIPRDDLIADSETRVQESLHELNVSMYRGVEEVINRYDFRRNVATIIRSSGVFGVQSPSKLRYFNMWTAFQHHNISRTNSTLLRRILL